MFLLSRNGYATMCIENILNIVKKLEMPEDESIPMGASVTDLECFEKYWGEKLPDKFRKWMLACNGPFVGPEGIVGINKPRKCQDIFFLYSIYPEWKELRWIPIAGDGLGNYYVMVTGNEHGAGQPIVFIDTMSSRITPEYLVASDIFIFLYFFIDSELNKINWPFNSEQVVASDPEILRFKNVSLPWD